MSGDAGITTAVREHNPKIVFLTSPNNPDGSMIAEAELLEILALPVLVVLDEAYIEFSEEASRMRWVLDHPNLVVLRTFSKSAGLAGLRVGYGAFPAGIIDYLWRAKQPYNVSVAAETAACAALTNPAYLEVPYQSPRPDNLLMPYRCGAHNVLDHNESTGMHRTSAPRLSPFMLCRKCAVLW